MSCGFACVGSLFVLLVCVINCGLDWVVLVIGRLTLFRLLCLWVVAGCMFGFACWFLLSVVCCFELCIVLNFISW